MIKTHFIGQVSSGDSCKEGWIKVYPLFLVQNMSRGGHSGI